MTPEKIKELSSPEAVDRLLTPPQSYGNGYKCCDQWIALAHALRTTRAELATTKHELVLLHSSLRDDLYD